MAQIRYEFIFDDKGVVTGVNKINEGLDASSAAAARSGTSIAAASGTMSANIGLVSRDLGGLVGSWNTLEKNTASASGTMTSSFDKVKTMAASVGIAFGALEAFQLFRQSVSDALDFQDAMANVNSILGDSQISSKQLGSDLLELSGALGSSKELADAMYEAIGAGIPAAESVGFVTEATKLAKATLADTGETTKLLAITMNAYGLKLSEVTHITDVFQETVASGIIRGEELAHELGTVIPTAALLGVSIEEVSAAIATMTKTGISASESTTALNQALLSFIKPSREAKGIAADLGIELDANAVRSKGFAAALADLKEKVAGNDEALIALFGSVRGGRAALSLTGEQAGFFTSTLEKMETQVGNNTAAFEKQSLTINSQLTRAWNDLQRVMDGFVNEQGGAVASLLKFLNDEIEKGWNPIMELKGGYVELFVAINNFKDSIFGTTPKVKEATVGFGDLRASIKETTVVQKENTGVTDEQRKANEKFRQEVDKVKEAVTGSEEKHRILTTAIKEMEKAGIPLEAITKKLGNAIMEEYNQTKLLSGAMDPVIGKYGDMITAKKTAAEKTEELMKEMKILRDIMVDAQPAAARLNEELRRSGEIKGPMLYVEGMQELIDIADQAAIDVPAAFDHIQGIADANAEHEKERLSELDRKNKEHAEQIEKVWTTAAGNITSGMAKAFTDVLFHGGNFFDKMVDLAKSIAEQMLQALLVGFLSPLTAKLGQLGVDLAKIIGLGGAAAGGVPGGTVPSIPGGTGPSGGDGGGGGTGPSATETAAGTAAAASAAAGVDQLIKNIKDTQDHFIADQWTPIQTKFGVDLSSILNDPAMANTDKVASIQALVSKLFADADKFAYQKIAEMRARVESGTATMLERMLIANYNPENDPHVKVIKQMHQLLDPLIAKILADLGGAAGPAAAQAASTGGAPTRAWSTNGVVEMLTEEEILRRMYGFERGTDYVPRTGLAYLHEGEAVLTKRENAERRSGRSGDDRPINVNFYGDIVTSGSNGQQMAREFKRELVNELKWDSEFKREVRREVVGETY